MRASFISMAQTGAETFFCKKKFEKNHWLRPLTLKKSYTVRQSVLLIVWFIDNVLLVTYLVSCLKIYLDLCKWETSGKKSNDGILKVDSVVKFIPRVWELGIYLNHSNQVNTCVVLNINNDITISIHYNISSTFVSNNLNKYYNMFAFTKSWLMRLSQPCMTKGIYIFMLELLILFNVVHKKTLVA